MSATINQKIFADYFTECSFNSLNIGGKTNFPITSIFLSTPSSPDNYIQTGFEIIKKLVSKKKQSGGYNSRSISSSRSSSELSIESIESTSDSVVNYSDMVSSEEEESNDILFFVTSQKEAQEVCSLINKNNLDGFCIEVYSGMDGRMQEIATHKNKFKNTSNKTIKIVIATNVAESSLTIDGIKYVIDSGYEFASKYDPIMGAKRLDKQLITHAQAKQRMGRAGRTEPGTCYHLYTEEQFNNMQKFPDPSIKTSNITNECLKLLSIESIITIENLKSILNRFIEPPKAEYIQHAIDQLSSLKLVENGEISPLGKMVVDTQLDAMMGLSVVKSIENNCMYEVLSLMAMLDACNGSLSKIFKNPMANLSKDDPKFKEKQKWIQDKVNTAKKHFKHKSGDHLSILTVFNKYTVLLQNDKSDQFIKDWCYKYFLNRAIIEKAIRQYKKLRRKMREIKYSIPKNEDSENSESLEERILKSIKEGFKLHIAKLQDTSYKTSNTKDIEISKDSFLTSKPKQVIYHELFIGFNKKQLNIVSIV